MNQMLYISTSVWVLPTPYAGWNMHFKHFLCLKAKKCKKVRNLPKNLAKNGFLKFAPKRWSSVLFQKNSFFLIVSLNQLTSLLLQTTKIHFFCLILLQISYFLAFFSFLLLTTNKNKILTSVFSGYHPNAGQNIQHIILKLSVRLTPISRKCSWFPWFVRPSVKCLPKKGP